MEVAKGRAEVAEAFPGLREVHLCPLKFPESLCDSSPFKVTQGINLRALDTLGKYANTELYPPTLYFLAGFYILPHNNSRASLCL